MIKINKNQTYIGGDEFEIYTDFVRLRAAIVKNPELMKVDQMAMETVKKAIKDDMLDELLGGKK